MRRISTDVDNLLNFLSQIGNFALPIFVLFTMFNVGLVQNVKDITNHLKK